MSLAKIERSYGPLPLHRNILHPSTVVRPALLLDSMGYVLPRLFLFLFFFFHLSLSTQTPATTTTTTTTAAAATDLVQKTCNTTTYYDFCVSSLQSDPKSPQADVRGLSAIAVHLAISNATNTSSFAATLAHSAADPSLRALLRECAAKYSNAREALQWSLDALSTEAYDYAFVHVSAAAEYPNVCRLLFRRHPRLTYPVEMASREEVLEHLCIVTLEIISLLG